MSEKYKGCHYWVWPLLELYPTQGALILEHVSSLDKKAIPIKRFVDSLVGTILGPLVSDARKNIERRKIECILLNTPSIN